MSLSIDMECVCPFKVVENHESAMSLFEVVFIEGIVAGVVLQRQLSPHQASCFNPVALLAFVVDVLEVLVRKFLAVMFSRVFTTR
jgi:hypothetical protein